MVTARQVDLRNQMKSYFDMAFNGETVFVPRRENKNVYIISQIEYENLQKAKRNAEYLTMLDHSIEQLNNNEVVLKSMEELRAMEG